MGSVSNLVTLLAISCSLMLFTGSCIAESYGPIELITPVEKSELWLNPGLLSYHFDQSKNFNAVNYGLRGAKNTPVGRVPYYGVVKNFRRR